MSGGNRSTVAADLDERIGLVREELRSDSALSAECDPDPESRRRGDELLDDFIDEERLESERASARRTSLVWEPFEARKVENNPAGRTILTADRRLQVAVVRSWFHRTLLTTLRLEDSWMSDDNWRADGLINRLFRRKLPYSDPDLQWILRCLLYRFELSGPTIINRMNITGFFQSVSRSSAVADISDETRSLLSEAHRYLSGFDTYTEERKITGIIEDLLGTAPELPIIDTSDDWGYFAAESLKVMSPIDSRNWTSFVTVAPTIPGTRPSQKWLLEAAQQISRTEPQVFIERVIEWLALLERPTRDSEYERADGFSYPSALIVDRNADLLKGLAWASSILENDALVSALGDAALACYKKIPNYGARSTKAGNACVQALGTIASLTSITQLQRLLQRVKLPSQTTQVEGALAAAAQARGLSAEDLEELVVPMFGLVNGIASRAFGEFTAELTVRGSDTVDLRWLRAEATSQKSVPWQVKSDYPDRLKELKREQKEIREALAVQRSRTECLMVDDRNWSFPDWRERYLDHPLVSLIASRLLWTFEQDDISMVGGCIDGQVAGLDDGKLDWLGDATRVRIWHPIESPADEVLAWREWLERHEVTQPFKQAHREIYILTDAERETETYSNRFAAHILRQHQLNALCQQRGWRYRLQGAWDGFNVPTLEFPALGLQAEYWVEGIEQGDGGGLSSAYIYLYAATDQVRFADSASGVAIPLAEIPPRLFSEVMRDVDLFVGVASIGADPHWLDGGQARMDGYQSYWWDFSFGELTIRAKSRRESLARLLPRMSKLDGRWELDVRFLKIRGEIRSYKIHLGSGNILMEPNDQYLCIVPGRGARGRRPGDDLFLPFEGDQTLSVILSKALMLAEDADIKDPTIKMQISPSAS